MKTRRTRGTTVTAYLFLTPALLGLFFITIFPMIGVIAISLTNWTGLEKPLFTGLDNYREIFTTDFYFAKSVAATLYFALGAVISGIIYAFTVALMLNQRILGRGFWRSVFFIPYIVPSIGSCIVWSWMYEANFGVFNYFLHLVGINKIQWLQSSTFAVPSLIVMTVWGMGSMIVIFLAGLQNVPRAYLEAVDIDGGNAWHKFRHITDPHDDTRHLLQFPDEHDHQPAGVRSRLCADHTGSRAAGPCSWSSSSTGRASCRTISAMPARCRSSFSYSLPRSPR